MITFKVVGKDQPTAPDKVVELELVEWPDGHVSLKANNKYVLRFDRDGRVRRIGLATGCGLPVDGEYMAIQDW